MERYYSYSRFLKERFGEKLYKICLDGGFTCPNRDGSLSTGGCIFCSGDGSGEFAESSALSIREQLLTGRSQTEKKYVGKRYLAYFQAFTGTYAPVNRLRFLYEEALSDEAVAALIIATRPDCLPDEVMALLCELNRKKPVFLELGLQTCHNSTGRFINRGYDTEQFTDAVMRCHENGIRVAAHLILGLPGESMEMQLQTIDYINSLPVDGVKLSMLYVLKNTPLATLYEQGSLSVFTPDGYVDCVIRCIEHLRPDIVIERITGDGPKDMVLAPRWSLHKRAVLNSIHKEMSRRSSFQGKTWQHISSAL